MADDALGIDVDDLAPREIPHPPHSWETAKRCIREACDADEHDWAELTGLDPRATGGSVEPAE